MEYENVLASIEAPNFKEKRVKKYQSTNDIIKDLIYCFKNFNYQAQPIAKQYGTGNITNDGKEIYDFIRKNIKYDAEPEADQTTRSFSRIIYDKEGADCKHTALIVGSIGWNEGYTVIFRVVRYVIYNGSNKEYLHHVYAILENKNGKQVIVDPLQKFNYEKPYDKKIGDYKAKNMALTRLTGVGRSIINDRNLQRLRTNTQTPATLIEAHEIHLIDGLGEREIILSPNGMTEANINELSVMQGIGRKTKKQRQAARSVRKEKRVVKRTARKTARKERGGVLKAVALAPVRGAFSALLILNFKNFAGRMKQAIDKGKENEVKAFAKKFGYKYNIFKGQILRGAKKHALGEINGTEIHQVEGMGFVVSAAAITAAAPAVVAAIALFKKLLIGDPSDDTTLKEAADNVTKLPEVASPETTGTASETPASLAPTTTTSSTNINIEAGQGKDRYPEGANTTASETPAPELNPELATRGRGRDAATKIDSGLLDKIKDLPTPVIIVGGVGLSFVAGKLFKIW